MRQDTLLKVGKLYDKAETDDTNGREQDNIANQYIKTVQIVSNSRVKKSMDVLNCHGGEKAQQKREIFAVYMFDTEQRNKCQYLSDHHAIKPTI